MRLLRYFVDVASTADPPTCPARRRIRVSALHQILSCNFPRRTLLTLPPLRPCFPHSHHASPLSPTSGRSTRPSIPIATASAANASGFLLVSLSKTPRLEIPAPPKFCPEAFPIKASDNAEVVLP